MPYGYHGKILRVDLTTATLSIERPNRELYRHYLGGSALNLYYLLKEMPAGADPLGPDNILGLSVGVITGVPISGQSRMTATAKSPLTGAIGDSQCGGFWPARLKWTGFDGIIISGKAAKPCYLLIDDHRAELRDAAHLWGRQTGEVQHLVRTELEDRRAEVLQIGPAGERLVRYSAIINMCNRANGRTGMGAVMGSKHLKAIVVRGRSKPAIADRKRFDDLVAWGTRALPTSGLSDMGKYGTAGVVSAQHKMGGLPSYNFNSGVFAAHRAINGQSLYHKMLAGRHQGKQQSRGRDTCYGCIIRCKRVVACDQAPYLSDPLYGGPEYETLAALGSYCGVDNIAAICTANELCNRYGIDTISCGATIAWAMEAFEAGELALADTGGVALRFGDAEALIAMVEMIAQRRGFGDLLAEGSQRAADQLNKGHAFLTTSKGQEAPAHMPQVKRSLALIYAVNPFGADHESSDHDLGYDRDAYEIYQKRYQALGLSSPQPARALNPAKVEFARKTQQVCSLNDSLCLCQFVWGSSWQLYGPRQIAELVAAVTGWDVTLDELLEVGERRINMMRLFNMREGIDARADTLPKKFFKPLKGGPSDGLQVAYDAFTRALPEYYRKCGWDENNGTPSTETLLRLGLDNLIE
jgi:aldehyde:ferredoxin oxidoreductase